MGYGSRVTEAGGSQKPHKPHIYFNKRAEMWGNMKDFLKIGCINNDEASPTNSALINTLSPVRGNNPLTSTRHTSLSSPFSSDMR
jgi:hypothetical protein